MKRISTALIVIMLLLAACSPTAETSTPETNPLPTPPAKPEQGKATVVGRALSLLTGEPLGNTMVRLAEVVRQGDQAAFVLDAAFSPGATTDAQGYFIMANIAPMEYVIVVGNIEIYQGYQIIQDETGLAKPVTIPADKVTDLEELRVNISGQ